MSIDYAALRAQVLAAAREGRATYLPAGARANATAHVYIDGEYIGQASTVAHYVRTDPDNPASAYAETVLLPGYDHQIPDRLKIPKH
ncbi:hypothetical protein Q3O43_29375 (plasmid) [Rhodococcus aetherivorans]|uniref:hypothetical protein n=1 Tax=Rhodococcus aetherivorans TaxID=191292 RepID=UPI0026EE5BD3|nr:hypothetical protein [Rhodococcus aetherivorans]WKX01989.1 hypothetical protein Q3O43_29375 [Rhodococcus aetherivorans]